MDKKTYWILSIILILICFFINPFFGFIVFLGTIAYWVLKKKDFGKVPREHEGNKKDGDNKNNDLVQGFKGRGEKLLKENIVNDNEKFLVKLQGTFGEGLVITNQRMYVLKWGFMAGNTGGGRCNVYEFRNITGLEIKKGMLTGTFEVLTPSNQNAQKSYWDTGSNSAVASDNVVTFQKDQFGSFQRAVKMGRELVNDFHSNRSI
jgi:hypothetical protein